MKVEEPEPKLGALATTVITPAVPVITSSKLQSVVPGEPMPLNVSIRLPEDMNERKNLIKRLGNYNEFSNLILI